MSVQKTIFTEIYLLLLADFLLLLYTHLYWEIIIVSSLVKHKQVSIKWIISLCSRLFVVALHFYTDWNDSICIEKNKFGFCSLIFQRRACTLPVYIWVSVTLLWILSKFQYAILPLLSDFLQLGVIKSPIHHVSPSSMGQRT